MAWQYGPPFGAAIGFAFAGPAYTPPFGAAVAFAFAFAPPGAQPIAGDAQYPVGQNTPLRVAAPGLLAYASDPDGQALTAHLLTAPAHGTATVAADGGFEYLPDHGWLGTDAFTWYVRNEDGLVSDPATVTLEVARVPVVRYAHTGAALPWDRPAPTLRSVAAGFVVPPRVRRAQGLEWGRAEVLASALEIAWLRAERIRRSTGLAFAIAPRLAPPSVESPWRRPPRQPTGADLPWSMPPAVRTSTGVPWSLPPTRRRSASLPWTMPPALRHSAGLPWSLPPRRELRRLLPWSHAPQLHWTVRTHEVTPPEPPAPPPQYQPPFGAAVGLNFVCRQVDLPGMMIPLRFGPAACYAAWPRPRTYVVLNTAQVVATATGQAIAVSSIDIRASADDMHHAFALTLADAADLAWLTPTADGPVEIEININGYLWTGLVESWDSTEAFPARTVHVAGRSLSALLDAPYAPARAYVETAERTAQQLADREVELTGFSVDYGIVGWTVPGGAWNYDAQPPAGALRTLAAAAGAVARAHPWQRVIEVRPRWPVSPWQWSTTAPDKTVLDDYVPRLVGRNSTSAAPIYELDIPLWPGSAGDKPGLLRPGQLVEFAALAGWRAQVESVRIAASMQGGNGAAALVVWQTVTLEAPPADPRFDYVLVTGTHAGVCDPVIRDGSAGTRRLPQIVDPLITEHAVAAERGRNALAGGADGSAVSNLWLQLNGLIPSSRLTVGNVTALNPDGSYTIATSDGATIRARPLPGQDWEPPAGVMVIDGRIIDSAPSLPGVTQYV